MFGERLAEKRKEKGLTLEQLAQKVGSTKSYIWQLENKPGVNPSAQLVSDLASVLGVTVEELISGSGSSEDQVFFRDYQSLKLETKKTISKIMQALKDGDQAS
ncbi:helix-turn-helix domain-containing protein [Marinobacter gelidimuriae]|jgi:transcriptional regulator with XRE-family HTH domain|uniref:helix-turn-helix domain-containing protein n=1 Tax=Marinobacter gelidimuriae TaxID=2739064 RepID=UPI0003810064|nr:helix-turn-helix transcriptional regulator [Marinobacter gelidimuriae]